MWTSATHIFLLSVPITSESSIKESRLFQSKRILWFPNIWLKYSYITYRQCLWRQNFRFIIVDIILLYCGLLPNWAPREVRSSIILLAESKNGNARLKTSARQFDWVLKQFVIVWLKGSWLTFCYCSPLLQFTYERSISSYVEIKTLSTEEERKHEEYIRIHTDWKGMGWSCLSFKH